MKTKIFYYCSLLCIGMILPPKAVMAYDYHGRASLGGYLSKEEHEPEPQGTTSNDFATASARLFYQASQIGSNRWIFTMDLRDKNDFFNQLDQERKELTENNTFQLRQLSLRQSPSHGIIWELGRYAIPDAGAVFNDGLTLGWRFRSTLSAEIFGGLNPKAYDKSYLEHDPKASSYGAIVSYVPVNVSWNSRKEFHLAHVTQLYDGETDRQYLYEQSVFQWGPQSLFSTIVYLDFVPRTYVQNGQLLYNQQWTERYTTNLTLSAFDVIEYRRQQDLREELEPSPYQEATLKNNYQSSQTNKWSLLGKYGRREIDNLERVNFVAELSMPRYFSKNTDLSVRAAQKKEFTKTGSYGGFGIGYFTDRNEYEFSLDAGVEKLTDDTTLHPIIAEVNYGTQISKRYYGAGGLQYQQDEKVKIYSVFFKVSYRFGNKETAPLRDGAPPRGRM